MYSINKLMDILSSECKENQDIRAIAKHKRAVSLALVLLTPHWQYFTPEELKLFTYAGQYVSNFPIGSVNNTEVYLTMEEMQAFKTEFEESIGIHNLIISPASKMKRLNEYQSAINEYKKSKDEYAAFSGTRDALLLRQYEGQQMQDEELERVIEQALESIKNRLYNNRFNTLDEALNANLQRAPGNFVVDTQNKKILNRLIPLMVGQLDISVPQMIPNCDSHKDCITSALEVSQNRSGRPKAQINRANDLIERYKGFLTPVELRSIGRVPESNGEIGGQYIETRGKLIDLLEFKRQYFPGAEVIKCSLPDRDGRIKPITFDISNGNDGYITLKINGETQIQLVDMNKALETYPDIPFESIGLGQPPRIRRNGQHTPCLETHHRGRNNYDEPMLQQLLTAAYSPIPELYFDLTPEGLIHRFSDPSFPPVTRNGNTQSLNSVPTFPGYTFANDGIEHSTPRPTGGIDRASRNRGNLEWSIPQVL